MIFERENGVIEINLGSSNLTNPPLLPRPTIHDERPWLRQVSNTKPSAKTYGKTRQRKL